MNKILSLFIVFIAANTFAQVNLKPAAPSAPSTGTPVNATASGTPIKLDRSKITNRIKLQFDEDLVKGNAENTELNFIQTRKENSFKKMIKIRENFIPEIESSASELGSK